MESAYEREVSREVSYDERPIKILVFALAMIITGGWGALLIFNGWYKCGGLPDEEVDYTSAGIKLFFKALFPHTSTCCPLHPAGTCSMAFVLLAFTTLIVCPCTVAGGLADWSWRMYPDVMEDLRAKSILLLFSAAAGSLLVVATAIMVSAAGAAKTSGMTWYIAAGLMIGNWACLFLAGSRGLSGLLGGPVSSSEDEGFNKQKGKKGGGKGFPPGACPPGGFPPGGFPAGGFPPGGPPPGGFQQGGFPPGSKGGPPMGAGGKPGGGFPGGKPQTGGKPQAGSSPPGAPPQGWQPPPGSAGPQDPAASSAAFHKPQ